MMFFDLTDPFGVIGWDLIEMDLIGLGAVADMK